MWNPFSRLRSRPSPSGGRRSPLHATRPEDLPHGSRRGSLADIEFIGETAVATLTVTELTSGAGADQLATLLHELAETGARHFILDVQNVQHMDSGCLGVLVEATGHLAKHGGRIALVNADRSVSYLFKLTRLDRIFPICRDVMSALAAVERIGNGTNASDAA